MKGGKMAKRSSFGSIVRKRLSDITNSLPQPKSSINVDKLSPTASSAKEYIGFLVKENMALAQLIADKNKIIELSGNELQKLRVGMQKLQLQNWNLAQSNSHISAELNMGREKLKTLQHELVCQKALLKAKNLELEGKGKMNGQTNGSQGGEKALEEDKPKADNKSCNSSRRRPTRSKSMAHFSAVQQVAEKGSDGNKRRCLRRQSASFKPRQQEPNENLFEIEDVKFQFSQPADSPMHEDGRPSSSSSITKEEKHEKSGRKSDAQESKRISIGRPLRKAAEKVQSYKEAPINIKMRRAE